jgi:hypothetical protein
MTSTMYAYFVVYADLKFKRIPTDVKLAPGDVVISAVNQTLADGSLLYSTKAKANESALSMTLGDVHV